MFRFVSAASSIAIRALIALILFGGPVYGVNSTILEGKTTLSNGAGLVLLHALQRPRG